MLKRPTLFRVVVWCALSLVVPAAAFFLWVTPLAPRTIGWRATDMLCRTLGAPVSAVNLVAPPFLRSAVAFQFEANSLEAGPWPTELARYVILGFIAYLPLFALLDTIARLLFARRRVPATDTQAPA